MANALESSVANQQLVLRNFSGQEKVQATWSGTGVVLEQPQWREFGILKVDAVKLKGQKLTLRCTRRGVVRDGLGRTEFYGQPSKVNIEVDLQGADPKQALPLIREALFFPSLDDASAAIPKSLQETIPFRIDAPWPAHKTQVTKLCDCASSGNTPCETDGSENAQVRPPRFLHGTDPRFSDDARRDKLNGNVIVHLVADKAGNPQDVWVVRPLGLGLDEAAAKAVLTYAFQPATCHGNPVSVHLDVEVNFKIY
jgi:TonB family protein